MSIASEISRISGNVQSTIEAIAATGVTVPENANSDNLPSLAQALANTKQDKLIGTEGQVVGFDADGNAVAQDAPDGLPEGGTEGQVLTKTASGAEWSDSVVYINTYARATSWNSVEGGKYQIEIDIRDYISDNLYHELLIANDKDLLIVITPDPTDTFGIEVFETCGIYYYRRIVGTTFSLRAKTQPDANIGVFIHIIRRTEASTE